MPPHPCPPPRGTVTAVIHLTGCFCLGPSLGSWDMHAAIAIFVPLFVILDRYLVPAPNYLKKLKAS